jgi:hypothetical protein
MLCFCDYRTVCSANLDSNEAEELYVAWGKH